MAAIMRRLRKNAMRYQLDYDRRVHMPGSGPRFYRRLQEAWLQYGVDYNHTTGPVINQRIEQKRLMAKLRTWYFSGGLSGKNPTAS